MIIKKETIEFEDCYLDITTYKTTYIDEAELNTLSTSSYRHIIKRDKK